MSEKILSLVSILIMLLSCCQSHPVVASPGYVITNPGHLTIGEVSFPETFDPAWAYDGPSLFAITNMYVCMHACLSRKKQDSMPKVKLSVTDKALLPLAVRAPVGDLLVFVLTHAVCGNYPTCMHALWFETEVFR